MEILYQSGAQDDALYQSSDVGNPWEIDWSKVEKLIPPVTVVTPAIVHGEA